MNAIKPGSIKDDNVLKPGTNFKEFRKSISKFLEAAAKYGVATDQLFQVNDLLLLQNLPKVTATIFELGRIAKESDNDFNGPYLGEIPYECIDPKTKRRAGMPEGKIIFPHHSNHDPSSSLFFLFITSECSSSLPDLLPFFHHRKER